MMEITISGDEEQPSESLWSMLRREERELAQKEGREPAGWYWVEGMEGPAPIDFSDEDEK